MHSPRAARRAVFASLLAVLLLVTSAWAQDRTVRILVGFAPGAGTDLLARLVADKMRVSLAQPVIVENKPGVSGIVATEAAKAAVPNGLTLILQPLAPMVAHPYTYAKLSYDPIRDFDPVAHLAEFQLALAVGPQLGVRTVRDYVALVKKDRSAGFFGTPGPGGLPHFFGIMIGNAGGVELTHVPYKGAAPAMQALAGGSVPAAVVPLPDAVPLARSGKAVVLGVSGAKRSAAYPDAPTFRESGYAVEGSGWYALFAPANTPKEVLARQSRAAVDAVKSPDTRDKIAAMGLEPTGYGAVELAAIMKSDHERWGPIIKASGFRATD